MHKLPPKYVGAYAEQDAVLTLKLWERFKTEIAKQELGHIFDLETSLIPVMLDMREKGVRVDLNKTYVIRKE